MRLYGHMRSWGCADCEYLSELFGGECGRVVGKLSHHLFIQSTEEGVSSERGAAFHAPLGEYCRSRVVFLATSTFLCLEK